MKVIFVWLTETRIDVEKIVIKQEGIHERECFKFHELVMVTDFKVSREETGKEIPNSLLHKNGKLNKLPNQVGISKSEKEKIKINHLRLLMAHSKIFVVT